MAKKSPKTETPPSPEPEEQKPAEAQEQPENPAPASNVEEITASEINSAVEMPTPNERTIEALQKDETGSTPPPATPGNPGDPKPGERDAWNRPYNPDSFHPRKAKNGTWISKGGGRKKEKMPTAGNPENPGTRSVVGEPGSVSGFSSGPGDRFDAAAEVYTRAAYSITDGLMNGNGEWMPDNDAEHVAFRNAMASYLRAKGSEDLPPGAALCLAAASYAGKRVTRPNTATRIRLIGAWVKAKWQNWRNRKTLAALPLKEIKPEEQSPLPPVVEKKGEES